MAARVTRIRHDDNTRLKIKVGHILHRLQQHFDGALELSPTQISTAKLLLAKVLPDLSAVAHSGEVTLKNAPEMSDAELAGIAAGRRNRTAEAPGSPEGPDTVH